MNVKTIIDKLGGYEENPLCKYKSTINDVILFENEFKVELPVFFREFLIEYMPLNFVENVHHKCSNSKLKKRLGLESFSVSHFFSLNSDDKCSIQSVIRSLDHLEKNYIPFCYGEFDDFLCISVNKHDFGFIYYFLTVSIDDFHLFKIADSFPTFFKGLFINNEEDIDDNDGRKVIKATYSDEFIGMGRKKNFCKKLFANHMSFRQIGDETTAQKYVIDVIKKVERVEIKDALKDENE